MSDDAGFEVQANLCTYAVAGTVVRSYRLRVLAVVVAVDEEHAKARVAECIERRCQSVDVGSGVFDIATDTADGLSMEFHEVDDDNQDEDEARWVEPPTVTEE